MNHCPQSALIPAACDGELDAARRRDLEAHLPSCPACSRALREQRLAAQLVRDAAPRDLDGQQRRRLLDALADLHAPAVVRTLRLLTGLAAAILLACTLALWFTPVVRPTPGAAERALSEHPAWEHGPVASPEERLNPFDPRANRLLDPQEGDL